MLSDVETSELLRKFLRLLFNDKKLRKLYTFSELPHEKIDNDELIKLLSKPYLLEYDSESGKLFYINDKGERENCPELVSGLTYTSDWISDTLPVVPFDIEQGGNVRRANEAEYIYKAALIAGILRGEFEEDFRKVLDSYDFSKLDKVSSDGMNFCELVEKWQSLQNRTVRVIISGANYKIASEKKAEAGFVIGSLNREETIGVVSIRTKVKAKIRSYMETTLSPIEVKKLTKIERLQEIQKKDDEVLNIIRSNKKYSQLYMICSMDAEYLDANVKLILSNSAKNFSRKEALEKFIDDEPGYKKFVSSCRRRAYKEATSALKEQELVKWRLVGNENYNLPPKR